MKPIHFILLFGIILTLVSCGKENILEGDVSPRYFLITTDERPNKLQLLESPSNKILDEDVFFTRNQQSLGNISTVAEFRETLFILQHDDQKITITDKELRAISQLDFTPKQLKPSSICFPNATTSFISFENDSLLEVLDLTNFVLAREVKVPHRTNKLIASGYYVFALHFYDSKLSIIDTRNYSLITTINLPDYPQDFDLNPDGSLLYVLCLGKGKIDTKETPSPAKLITLTTTDFAFTKEAILNLGSIPATSLLTTGLAIANKYFGYISSKTALIRFSAVNTAQFQKLISGDFTSVIYNYKRDEIIAIETKNNRSISIIYIINPTNASVTSKVALEKTLKILVPR